ncbi:MAG: PrsW family glutamic-type intramembrane protease [Planctomycetota bacterium]
MAAKTCPRCSTELDPSDPPGQCPFCGASTTEVPKRADSDVRAACAGCGARLVAPANYAGKTLKCKRCGGAVRFPAAVPAPSQVAPADPAPFSPIRPQSPKRPAPKPTETWRVALQWAFVATLVPLLFSFIGRQDDTGARLERTFDKHPEVFEKVQVAQDDSPAEVLDKLLLGLPGRRIEGAYLSRDSAKHWFFALLAAGLFFGYFRLAFPRGQASGHSLPIVAAVTGTVGIVLLLAFQWFASYTQGRLIVGRGLLMIFFYIAKFIGWSYNCALDESNGFLVSLFGFTMGVGLCEELTKSAPVINHFRVNRRGMALDWRGAVLWGLMSGAGFGIAEAIHYSSAFYNGISTGGIYWVRFISCISIHAVWSGAAALIVWNDQDLYQGDMDWTDWAMAILRTLWVVMLLHGLYDTCLKKDLNFLAALTAIASFGWFGWQYDKARRTQARADQAFATA